MVQNTPVILLDEPMSALDLTNQTKLLKLFKKLTSEDSKTIVFSTHDPNHALFLNCNTILLKNGTVMNIGNADECLTNQNLQTIYGNQIQRINYYGKGLCIINI